MTARIWSLIDTSLSQFWVQPFFNGVLMCGFYSIAGMTAVWSTMSIIKRDSASGKIFLKLFLFRWLRYVPSMMSVIAVNLVWPLFGSGPMFSELTSFTIDNCSQRWWRNLLLINNLDDPRDICVIQTWYLSTDLQLFVLGLISIGFICWKEEIGLSFCTLIVLIGMIVPGVNLYLYDHIPTGLIYRTE